MDTDNNIENSVLMTQAFASRFHEDNDMGVTDLDVQVAEYALVMDSQKQRGKPKYTVVEDE